MRRNWEVRVRTFWGGEIWGAKKYPNCPMCFFVLHFYDIFLRTREYECIMCSCYLCKIS